jgi:thioredoxin
MNLVELSTPDFDAFVSRGAVLVEFGTAWCGPCRAMLPVLAELAGELPDVRFAKVDVEEQQALGQRFDIRSMPTLILFVDGRPVDQSVGSMPKAKLKAKILEKLARFRHAGAEAQARAV